MSYVVNFDPIIFSLGPIQPRWYGLMYVFGFVIGSQLLTKLSKEGFFKVSKEKIDAFVLYLILGLFIFARLFYMLIYGLDDLISDPMELFAVWHGGLSFHGGMIGFIVVCFIYGKKNGIAFFNMGDSIALGATQGLFWGRIGNFINGELYGRVTDVPWAMIYSTGGSYPRHPSQLYEAFGEGVLLTLILWFFIKKRARIEGTITASFIFFYGVIRFFLEYFREPDEQLGKYFGLLSMGQILCFMMILSGLILYGFLYFKNKKI